MMIWLKSGINGRTVGVGSGVEVCVGNGVEVGEGSIGVSVGFNVADGVNVAGKMVAFPGIQAETPARNRQE